MLRSFLLERTTARRKQRGLGASPCAGGCDGFGGDEKDGAQARGFPVEGRCFAGRPKRKRKNEEMAPGNVFCDVARFATIVS